MTPEQLPYVCAGILIISFLYSSVGLAGASGYIAVLALSSMPSTGIKPVALTLTLIVSAVGSYQFWRAGHFSWELFWPLAVSSIPAAFVGGYINLPPQVFKVLLGVVLLYSAAWFLVKPPPERAPQPPRLSVALLTGAGIGFVAGLTGSGGGIFLSPLMIVRGWAPTKTVVGIAALFIFVNASAGLAGHLASEQQFPIPALALAVAALVGGWIGAYLGSRRFTPLVIKRILAVVLTVAGLKLIVG
jgi:uncharacterized protein